MFNHTSGMEPACDIEYDVLSTAFRNYHQNRANVLLHCITTPLGLIGFIGLFLRMSGSTSLLVTLMVSYLLFVLPSLTIGSFLATLLLCSVMLALCRNFKFRVSTCVTMIISGYLLQDLSHWLTSEGTFQASYSAGGQVYNKIEIVFFIWCFISYVNCV